MKHDMQLSSVIGAVLPLFGAFLLASAAAAPAAEQKTNALAAAIEWKHPDWKDPEKVIASVNWDGVPLGEVVRSLREEFKHEFDVLVPAGVPRDPTTGERSDGDTRALGDVVIQLQLQNVRASEIFNAMNMLFEAERYPQARWELRMNGTRPTAVLRPLPPQKSDDSSRPQEQPKRSVYFVGDAVGDPETGGMSWDQFRLTVAEVLFRAYQRGSEPKIDVHREAALLIVTGNQDQNDFIRTMLEALKEKAKLELARKALSKPAEARQKPSDAKTP